ncbi:hypothetical protein [Micromonospora schwarzwaldensis]|uniref:hypothetical protein n=1 Tax=Micromonospora sp. DSM 45708 TaxID=3111767 RepID=UPI0031DEA704
MTILEGTTRFADTQFAARAVALCGWAATGAGLDVVPAVLGDDPVVTARGTAPDSWTCAERPDSQNPLGPTRTAVVLTTDVGATVRIAIGSQAWPPSSPEPPAWTVDLRPDEQLVVDGRCSIRVTGGTATTTEWTAK